MIQVRFKLNPTINSKIYIFENSIITTIEIEKNLNHDSPHR